MKIECRSLKDTDLNGKIIVVNEEWLSERHRIFNNRLYRVTGGFGAAPNSMGRAIFAECLADGIPERFDHDEVDGWLTDDEADTVTKKETGMSLSEFMVWTRLSNES